MVRPPLFIGYHIPPFLFPAKRATINSKHSSKPTNQPNPTHCPFSFVPLVMVKTRWQNRSNPSIGPLPLPYHPTTPPSPNSPILGSAVF